MIRLIRIVVIAVVAIVLITFAFANREWVTVSFDPLASGADSAFAMSAPLFAVVIATAMLGVIAGAAATWVSQGRHRRAARQNRADAEKWRSQAGALRSGPPGSF
jgi:uncharacterized integral membrane protein